MSYTAKGSIIAGALAVGSSFVAAPVSAETTLKFANWLPPVHHWTSTARKFSDSIEAASGGKIKVKMDKGALAKPPGQFDLAVNGVRDMVMHVAAYTPGRFVFYRMAEIPFATKNAATGSEGFHKWYVENGFDKKEFKGAKLLSGFVHGPGMLHSKKEIKSLSDIKGVKIRVGGGGVLIAKSLGAVPVAMSATKEHESLQRGTTDAAFFPYEAVHGFKLAKLVKYHLEVPGGLYTTPFMVAMSGKKWNSLTAQEKRWVDKATGAAGAKLIGAGWDAADQVGKNAAKKAGNVINVISDAEKAKWAKAIAVITENWIKKANDAGQNGQALVDSLRKHMGG